MGRISAVRLGFVVCIMVETPQSQPPKPTGGATALRLPDTKQMAARIATFPWPHEPYIIYTFLMKADTIYSGSLLPYYLCQLSGTTRHAPPSQDMPATCCSDVPRAHAW